MGEPVTVIFDAKPPAGAEVLQHRFEIEGRIGAGAIAPDADVFDIRRVLGLPQIRRAGQQRGPPVGRDIEALEEAEAETVVAGQPIIALLREQQRAIEFSGGERRDEQIAAAQHFLCAEMYRHLFSVPRRS